MHFNDIDLYLDSAWNEIINVISFLEHTVLHFGDFGTIRLGRLLADTLILYGLMKWFFDRSPGVDFSEENDAVEDDDLY